MNGAASRSGSSSAPSRCWTRCRRWIRACAIPKSDNTDQQPEYAKNELRSIKPEISVLVGLCTHLGCSPEMTCPRSGPQPFDPEWKGGYFCPCHKSRFDLAGRVFQGVPAPANLLVPPYHFEDDTTIVIGVDASQQGSRVSHGERDRAHRQQRVGLGQRSARPA